MPAWRLETYDFLPSTSDLCVRRAREGEESGLAVQALRQTAGRGSRGRAGATLDGTLARSVLQRPGGNTSLSGQWAIAGAVAFRQALAQFADNLTIKWPNDILRNGSKAAGLLINAEANGRSLSWVVLGFGANLRAAPEGAAVLGPFDPGTVANAVLDHLTAVLRTWRHDEFHAIRHMWLTHAHPLGAALRVRAPGLDVAGSFAGLTPDGALLLGTPDGTRTFSTGEVLLG